MRTIAFILASIATGFAAENTEELFKELATAGTTGVRRDKLVAELSASTFAEAGTRAVQEICRHCIGLYSPTASKPWLDDGCPESERIRFAAVAIWRAVTEPAERCSLSEPLAKLSLEERPAGERMFYLNALL